MIDPIADFLRLTGYGFGLAVSLFGFRYWLQVMRRWIGILITGVTSVVYATAFVYAVGVAFYGTEDTPEIVWLVVLITLGYLNPLLIALMIREDMKKMEQRRNALRMADKLDIDPRTFLEDEEIEIAPPDKSR